jgi:hypothetical protein
LPKAELLSSLKDMCSQIHFNIPITFLVIAYIFAWLHIFARGHLKDRVYFSVSSFHYDKESLLFSIESVKLLSMFLCGVFLYLQAKVFTG